MSSLQDGHGVALQNEANEIMRISEASGPITLVVRNLESHTVVVSATKKSDGALKALSEETAVAAENTGYTGNTVTLAFTGQVLNHLPIVPGSVSIEPTVGGNTVDAQDLNGDGKLYTDDVDQDYCGTINYFTGALVLFYPAGKAPNTGAISADYQYSTLIAADGIVTLHVPNFTSADDESLIIKAAGSSNSKVRIEAFMAF